MRLAHGLVLVLLAIGQAAAWDCPGGVKGSDQITGYTSFFGIKEEKPLKYIDHITAWKKFGPITKVNLFHSTATNCIAGLKVTYGYDARNAQPLGSEKDTKQASLNLEHHENINKVEIRLGASKCVEWIRLTTTKGKTVALGNTKSTSAVQVGTANRKDGFLAAIRGYEENAGPAKGSLQQLQFVWGVSVCPEGKPAPAAPKPAPAAPKPTTEVVTEVVAAPAAPAADAGEEPPAGPGPNQPPAGDEPPTGPTPLPEPEGPFCIPEPEKCNPTATSGPATCPYVAPFTQNQCIGGCCISAGKCRRGFCGQAGLGVEVMQPNLMCWGTNTGLLYRYSGCRNLACKLAVPGCISDHISGSCVGTVVPLSNDVDDAAKQWIGYPCLQTVPGGLPVDALGKTDVHGAYADKLWSICNCKANKLVPGYNSTTCRGPMCDLFKLPELPSLNFALPGFRLSDLGTVIDLRDWNWAALNDIARPQFTLPKVHVQFPDVKQVINDFRSYVNGTSEIVNPIIRAALQTPGYPSILINITRPELPTVTINAIQPNVQLNETVPQVRVALPNTVRTLNFTQLGVRETKDIEALLKAFQVNRAILGEVPQEALNAALHPPEIPAQTVPLPIQEKVFAGKF